MKILVPVGKHRQRRPPWRHYLIFALLFGALVFLVIVIVSRPSP